MRDRDCVATGMAQRSGGQRLEEMKQVIEVLKRLQFMLCGTSVFPAVSKPIISLESCQDSHERHRKAEQPECLDGFTLSRATVPSYGWPETYEHDLS